MHCVSHTCLSRAASASLHNGGDESVVHSRSTQPTAHPLQQCVHRIIGSPHTPPHSQAGMHSLPAAQPEEPADSIVDQLQQQVDQRFQELNVLHQQQLDNAVAAAANARPSPRTHAAKPHSRQPLPSRTRPRLAPAHGRREQTQQRQALTPLRKPVPSMSARTSAADTAATSFATQLAQLLSQQAPPAEPAGPPPPQPAPPPLSLQPHETQPAATDNVPPPAPMSFADILSQHLPENNAPAPEPGPTPAPPLPLHVATAAITPPASSLPPAHDNVLAQLHAKLQDMAEAAAAQVSHDASQESSDKAPDALGTLAATSSPAASSAAPAMLDDHGDVADTIPLPSLSEQVSPAAIEVQSLFESWLQTPTIAIAEPVAEQASAPGLPYWEEIRRLIASKDQRQQVAPRLRQVDSTGRPLQQHRGTLLRVQGLLRDESHIGHSDQPFALRAVSAPPAPIVELLEMFDPVYKRPPAPTTVKIDPNIKVDVSRCRDVFLSLIDQAWSKVDMTVQEEHVSKEQRAASRQQRKAEAKKRRLEAILQAEERRRAMLVVVPYKVTVKQLASLLEVSLSDLEAVLRDIGEAPQSAEEVVSPDCAELAALELDRIVQLQPPPHSHQDAAPRPPVITIMGHVDHGKTTLLDALRKTQVAAGEAGGITQHIGAFEVAMPGSKQTLTFLDTPGHAAFSSMRARGAAVTDIVVLVVAADDGVMPQTKEALAHIRAAKCPFVVAITKCDMGEADPARVRQQLLAEGMELEEAGGSVQVVEVAAAKKIGLQELEDALLLQAGELSLTSSPSRDAEAVVVETRMDKGMGPVATIIMRQGTLKPGQVVVVGTEWGKVKALRDSRNKVVKKATGGQPVELVGLRGLPQAGDELSVVGTEDRARRMAAARSRRSEEYRHSKLAAAVAAAQMAAMDSEDSAAEDDLEDKPAPRLEIPVVIKADVWGSAQAVQQALLQMQSDRVSIKPIYVGVGPISVSDVDLAAGSSALLVGFNTRSVGAAADAAAKRGGVEIATHRVIYHLLEDIAKRAATLAPTEELQVVLGRASVQQVFTLSTRRREGSMVVAGCRVQNGRIQARNCTYRVLRSGEVVFEGRLQSLKQERNEVQQVEEGAECGVLLEDFGEFEPGDVLECVGSETKEASSAEILASAPGQM